VQALREERTDDYDLHHNPLLVQSLTGFVDYPEVPHQFNGLDWLT